MIKLEHVTKRYLRKVALDDVTVTFHPGRIVGIIGENGSGKSTLLKLMAGLVRPTRGKVTVDGKPVTRTVSKNVAYLSEREELYDFFTVRETIDFFASQFHDFNREKAEALMHFMSLRPTERVKHLSKGGGGRLKMTLTLARNAPFVLLDEPLSGLDPFVREAVAESLLSFLDLSRQTLIVSTHEIQELEQLIDTVAVIRDGKMLDVADVEDIRETKGKNLVEWMRELYSHSVPKNSHDEKDE